MIRESSPGWGKILLSDLQNSKPNQKLTQPFFGGPPVSLVTKRLALEVDHSPPSIVEIKSEWNCTPVRKMCTCSPRVNFMFLGAFAKLRKASICFVMSVCLSVCPFVRTDQIGNQWSDFHEI